MRISKDVFNRILESFKRAWRKLPEPPDSPDFRAQLEQRLRFDASSPTERVERKFAAALDLDSARSDSTAFRRSVMDAVAELSPSAEPALGHAAVVAQFRRAVLLTPEPEPSVEFRHQLMTKVRREPAYGAEPEPSLLDVTMFLAERCAISLCSVSVVVSVIFFTQTSLISMTELTSLMILVG